MVAKRLAMGEEDSEPKRRRRPPATTPEDREQMLIGAAMDLAEKQILDGTASSQVVTHFLKIGSSRERLEKQKLEQENELLKAKIVAIGSGEEIKQLYGEALRAMRQYAGQEVEDDYEN